MILPMESDDLPNYLDNDNQIEMIGMDDSDVESEDDALNPQSSKKKTDKAKWSTNEV